MPAVLPGLFWLSSFVGPQENYFSVSGHNVTVFVFFCFCLFVCLQLQEDEGKPISGQSNIVVVGVM